MKGSEIFKNFYQNKEKKFTLKESEFFADQILKKNNSFFLMKKGQKKEYFSKDKTDKPIFSIDLTKYLPEQEFNREVFKKVKTDFLNYAKENQNKVVDFYDNIRLNKSDYVNIPFLNPDLDYYETDIKKAYFTAAKENGFISPNTCEFIEDLYNNPEKRDSAKYSVNCCIGSLAQLTELLIIHVDEKGNYLEKRLNVFESNLAGLRKKIIKSISELYDKKCFFWVDCVITTLTTTQLFIDNCEKNGYFCKESEKGNIIQDFNSTKFNDKTFYGKHS